MSCQKGAICLLSIAVVSERGVLRNYHQIHHNHLYIRINLNTVITLKSG
jgi:hypothetical protein